ncbi:hypothetical protein EYF80_020898 [Liparis tanakae]|uniref:Uncharacterized protein n=1 Tax=Liparis tanakae TaxID=230148 RepID=A0A4Z2HV74_9TELE|nr:hypothetical protein EYF80_020898 [Liparis tanakae]
MCANGLSSSDVHGPAVRSESVSLLNEKCQRSQSQQPSSSRSAWRSFPRMLFLPTGAPRRCGKKGAPGLQLVFSEHCSFVTEETLRRCEASFDNNIRRTSGFQKYDGHFCWWSCKQIIPLPSTDGLGSE